MRSTLTALLRNTEQNLRKATLQAGTVSGLAVFYHNSRNWKLVTRLNLLLFKIYSLVLKCHLYQYVRENEAFVNIFA